MKTTEKKKHKATRIENGYLYRGIRLIRVERDENGHGKGWNAIWPDGDGDGASTLKGAKALVDWNLDS